MLNAEEAVTRRNNILKPSIQTNNAPIKSISNRNNSNRKKPFSILNVYFLLAFAFILIISFAFSINYKFYTSFFFNEENIKENVKKNAVVLDSRIIKEKADEPITIAYAISITSCPNSRKDQKITDGAAILQHSIHLSSYQKNKKSKYNYQMIAIIHPSAMACSHELSLLGYIIKERDTPMDVSKIKSTVLRNGIVKSGCCQEKELIKLWAYTLIDYPVVVHLDVDTLVLQPMDELYDAMINGPKQTSEIPVMFNKALPQEKINAYFTRDYNMAKPGKPHVGVQGGFFIVKPNTTVFEEFITTIYTSDFRAGSGWGAKGFGNFYGAQQIQGLLPYYYDFLRPNEAVELNRCYYNAMGDNPRSKTDDGSLGICKDTNTYQCEDCRDTNFHKIKSVHYTLCKKPWMCRYCVINKKWREYCNFMHNSWYKVRKSLEDEWEDKFSSYRSRKHIGEYKVEHFYGFCKYAGIRGYVPLVLPNELGLINRL